MNIVFDKLRESITINFDNEVLISNTKLYISNQNKTLLLLQSNTDRQEIHAFTLLILFKASYCGRLYYSNAFRAK